MKGDCTPRGFEDVEKTVFCGKANRSKKEQGEPEAEGGMEDEAPNREVNVSGRDRMQRGWWKRGVVETKLKMVNMTAWVHKECECAVCMNDFERHYWMGTEIGQLGGLGFNEQLLA